MTDALPPLNYPESLPVVGMRREIVAAIRNGTAYANVHSSKWPTGEIRGQLH